MRPVEEVDSHEPLDSVERVEHLQLAAKALQKHTKECRNGSYNLMFNSIRLRPNRSPPPAPPLSPQRQQSPF